MTPLYHGQTRTKQKNGGAAEERQGQILASYLRSNTVDRPEDSVQTPDQPASIKLIAFRPIDRDESRTLVDSYLGSVRRLLGNDSEPARRLNSLVGEHLEKREGSEEGAFVTAEGSKLVVNYRCLPLEYRLRLALTWEQVIQLASPESRNHPNVIAFGELINLIAKVPASHKEAV